MQTSGCNFGVHYELSDCAKLPKSFVSCDSASVNNPNCSIGRFNCYKWLKTGYEISRLWGGASYFVMKQWDINKGSTSCAQLAQYVQSSPFALNS